MPQRELPLAFSTKTCSIWIPSVQLCPASSMISTSMYLRGHRTWGMLITFYKYKPARLQVALYETSEEKMLCCWFWWATWEITQTCWSLENCSLRTIQHQKGRLARAVAVFTIIPIPLNAISTVRRKKKENQEMASTSSQTLPCSELLCSKHWCSMLPIVVHTLYECCHLNDCARAWCLASFDALKRGPAEYWRCARSCPVFLHWISLWWRRNARALVILGGVDLEQQST